MLIPIAALNSFEPDLLRTALSGMTSGMSIALTVTVCGIATALALKFEYYLLDGVISELFDIITETSEVYVMSAIDGRAVHRQHPHDQHRGARRRQGFLPDVHLRRRRA